MSNSGVEINTDRGMVILVDEEDLSVVSAPHKWYPVKRGGTFYAVCGCCGINMHRLLFPDSEMVDHANMNGLDNRRSNLRPCSKSQNMANRSKTKRNASGFKGVSLCRSTRRWRADIQVRGNRINLGRFDSIEEAARAYANAATLYFGEFARS